MSTIPKRTSIPSCHKKHQATHQLVQNHLGTGRSETSVVFTRQQRENHTHIIGATGTGKSKLFEQMMREDSLDRRCGFALLDPHGSLYDDMLEFLSHKYPHLAERVVLFNPAQEMDHIIGFNPIPLDAKNNMDYILEMLISSCLKAWGQDSTDKTPRISKWLENIFHTVIANDLTLVETVPLLSVSKRYTAYREVLLAHVKSEVILDDWQMFTESSNTQRQSLIEGAANRLRKFLRNDAIRNIIGRSTRTLNLHRVMEEGKILLVNLNGMERISHENTRLLGIMLVNEFFRVARLRNARDPHLKPFTLYVDEFANFITKDIARALEECRKFKLSLVLAHQHMAQLKEEDEYLYASVLTNCKNKVVFGGLSTEDVRLMTDELATGNVNLYAIKDERYTTKVRNIEERRVVHGESTGSSSSRSQGQATSESHGRSETHGDSSSTSTSESTTTGTSETHGTSESHGKSTSRTTTVGSSESVTHTKGHSQGSSDSTTQGRANTRGQADTHGGSASTTRGQAVTAGTSTTLGTSQGQGTSCSSNQSSSQGTSSTQSMSSGVGYSSSAGSSSQSSGDRSSVGSNQNLSNSQNGSRGSTTGQSVSYSSGSSTSASTTSTTSESRSSSQSTTQSQSQTEGRNWSHTESSGVTESQGRTRGTQQGSSQSESHGHTDSQSESVGESQSEQYGRSHSISSSQSISQGKTHGTSQSTSRGSSTSHSTGTSEATSTGTSESKTQSVVPFLAPQEYQELAARTYWNKDELHYLYMAALKNQPPGQAFIKIGSNAPIATTITYVSPVLHSRLSQQKIDHFRRAVFRLNAQYYTSADEARAECEHRQNQVFGRPLAFDEPASDEVMILPVFERKDPFG